MDLRPLACTDKEEGPGFGAFFLYVTEVRLGSTRGACFPVIGALHPQMDGEIF